MDTPDERRLPGDTGIIRRRREALVLLRHFQPVLVLTSGRFLCMSDFLLPAREVARRLGVRTPAFMSWWSKETRSQFGRSMCWPRIALRSEHFCCDFTSKFDGCPVCVLLKPEERLQSIYNPQNYSIPALNCPELWASLACKPYEHPTRPDLLSGELELLWKDIRAVFGQDPIVHEVYPGMSRDPESLY